MVNQDALAEQGSEDRHRPGDADEQPRPPDACGHDVAPEKSFDMRPSIAEQRPRV